MFRKLASRGRSPALAIACAQQTRSPNNSPTYVGDYCEFVLLMLLLTCRTPILTVVDTH